MGFMSKKKSNMYYYGGRGDASRLYFVKHHPDTPLGKTAIKQAIGKIKTAMKKAGFSAKNIKEIEKSRQEFIKKYSSGIGSAEKAGEMFDKAFVNIPWKRKGPKIGRNDKVLVAKGTDSKVIKYKKFEKMKEDGWTLVEA